MPRGLFNWAAEDAIRFLKEYKFFHIHTKGSHMFYFGHYNGQPRQVCVPFHGKRVLKPRTLKALSNNREFPKRMVEKLAVLKIIR